jgi:hypothetical protein
MPAPTVRSEWQSLTITSPDRSFSATPFGLLWQTCARTSTPPGPVPGRHAENIAVIHLKVTWGTRKVQGSHSSPS